MLLSWAKAWTLPPWKVTTSPHNRTVVPAGLGGVVDVPCGMNTGQMYCKVNVSVAGTAPRSSTLPIALCITIFLVALLSLLVYLLGTGYNAFVDKEFVGCLVLTLISIRWPNHIIRDFSKHQVAGVPSSAWAGPPRPFAFFWIRVERLVCCKCPSEGSRAPAIAWLVFCAQSGTSLGASE